MLKIRELAYTVYSVYYTKYPSSASLFRTVVFKVDYAITYAVVATVVVDIVGQKGDPPSWSFRPCRL